MRPAHLLLCTLLAFSCQSCTQRPNPGSFGAALATQLSGGSDEAARRYASSDWRLVWSEEFDQGTAPSASIWSHEEGHLRNRELQYYTKGRLENVKVADGVLQIKALREAYSGAHYTSASLHTRGKKEFLYGKLEVRAKIPTGRGAWPAIWTLGSIKEKWPRNGEIDLMENVGWDPEKLHFTVHTAEYNHARGNHKSRAIHIAKPWEEFHTYGLIWTPDKIELFYDGQKVLEYLNEKRGPDQWPFDHPQYLLLNIAVGGAWGGRNGVDDAIFPLEMQVDYVRYWQSP
ncbi:MAG: glycoside hydrolase family 16 protein [Opitutaceae bacterium]|nr:glycoside hydrolase family 16 protein [Opitutaceae bacterium]